MDDRTGRLVDCGVGVLTDTWVDNFVEIKIWLGEEIVVDSSDSVNAGLTESDAVTKLLFRDDTNCDVCSGAAGVAGAATGGVEESRVGGTANWDGTGCVAGDVVAVESRMSDTGRDFELELLGMAVAISTEDDRLKCEAKLERFDLRLSVRASEF